MSPFLVELNPGHFERIGSLYGSSLQGHSESVAERRAVGSSRKKKRLEMSEFTVGGKVKHPFFGEGTVKKLSSGRSLDVRFDRHGLKTLHLDYAKLTIL